MSITIEGTRPARADLMQAIDLANPGTILRFGSGAQSKASETANSLLAATKARDAGVGGVALGEMLTALDGFSPSGEDKGFFGRLFSNAKRDMTAKLRRFETVKDQVEEIKTRMEGHRDQMLEDVETVGRLYSDTLEWFHSLEEHITAGDHRLSEGEAEHTAAKAALPADDTLAAQRLADQRAALDELERRVHDMRLTRQVVMQALPSLRLIQENDRALATKIQSVLTNTVPLWIQQMANAILIQRMAETGEMVKKAGDLTNRLLVENAKLLKEGTTTVRAQIDRGVFDINAVVEANTLLITTLREGVGAAEKAKQARQKERVALDKAEQDIRATLSGMKKAT